MIVFKVISEQPDIFNPDKELALVVTAENLIDGNKTQMRVFQNNLDRYKDKVTRDELRNTVTRMINGRYNNYKHSASTTPQYKWVAAKALIDRIETLNIFKTTFAVANYIAKHLLYHLDAVTPGEASRFHDGYVQKLDRLKVFVNQQILVQQSVQNVDCFNENMVES